MSDRLYAVVLSGGVGSRLWPVSRKTHPKPFMRLPDGRSILQNTLLRAAKLQPQAILSITNRDFGFKVSQEWNQLLPELNQPLPITQILEPFGRNTAAAIALACLWVAAQPNHDGTLLVLPSDHIITDQAAFHNAVDRAQELAHQGALVTFGITPTSPETGYGYLEFTGNRVHRFVEKPSLSQAQQYLATQRYLWNSGMFCFQAQTMLAEMEHYCPDILEATRSCLSAAIQDPNLIKLDDQRFGAIRSDSIDYAVMEHSARVQTVPCNIGWSDIGNWSSLSQVLDTDPHGNTLHGATTFLENVHNCHIAGHHSHKLIAALGIQDLVIVDTPDALLVAHKNCAQEVKKICDHLTQTAHPTHELHLTVERPWGSYTTLTEGAGFKVKRIEVHPQASLSLQSHQHRAENWVVAAGQAMVINGEQQLTLQPGEATYIPVGARHRLTNPSPTDQLVIIETQNGTYLGEDDIQRFDDIYGRC